MDSHSLLLAAQDIFTLGHARKNRLIKSLRDAAVVGGQYSTSQGALSVYQTNTPARYPRKQNVRIWRNYSQFNVWVRTCLDIYRNALSQAEMVLGPIDEERSMDKGVLREIEALLAHPNSKNKPYSQVKEEILEDHLVIGHGVGLKKILRNLQPYEIDSFDAARFAFNEEWNGDPSEPRYAIYATDYSKIAQLVPDPFAMVLMNTSTSYDVLGVSHIEKLDGAVRAMIAADDYLREQVLNPSPGGILNLGRGISQPQVDETRQQINALRKPLVIVGGTENVSYTGFTGDQSQQNALAASEWFVRQTCAVFNLPTAMVGLSVDTSRANTNSMLQMADTGLIYLLKRLQDMENAEIVNRFGPPEKHNVQITYPVLNQKDEQQQAQISQQALAGMAWRTLNEVRKDMGEEPLPLQMADEILVPVKGGAPVPLSYIEEQYANRARQEAAPLKNYRKRA